MGIQMVLLAVELQVPQMMMVQELVWLDKEVTVAAVRLGLLQSLQQAGLCEAGLQHLGHVIL